MGIIKWVSCVVTEPSFFSLSTDYCPVQLALLDEVVTCHPLLHQKVLQVSTIFYICLTEHFALFGHPFSVRFSLYILDQTFDFTFIFQLYIGLFEQHYESLEILAQLEIKKMLLDR